MTNFARPGESAWLAVVTRLAELKNMQSAFCQVVKFLVGRGWLLT